MTDQTPSDEDLVALLPALRRLTEGLGLDPATADDVVQETLARLLAERARLDRATLASYAIVTARNAAASLRRAEQLRARHQHRLLEPQAAATPEERALRREEHEAVAAALAALPEADRALLTARDVAGHPPAVVARQTGVSQPTLAVRLSRARARLRVEYLLALRHVRLPTSRCRPVLLALSSGDQRRQANCAAGQHLLSCPACAALAGPLLHRSRRLAGWLPWPGLAAIARRVHHALARHPAHAAAGATAVAGAAVAAVILTSGGTAPAPGVLTVAGRDLGPAAAAHLSRDSGQPAAAHRAPVLAVPAGEGFWIRGPGGARVWVQLTGHGESPQQVRPGDRVSFRGVVVANPPRYAARAGLDADDDAGLLTREGAHIDVRYTDLQVTRGTR
jgi:RNA polymerase sigma factor (sigma-70 family)